MMLSPYSTITCTDAHQHPLGELVLYTRRSTYLIGKLLGEVGSKELQRYFAPGHCARCCLQPLRSRKAGVTIRCPGTQALACSSTARRFLFENALESDLRLTPTDLHHLSVMMFRLTPRAPRRYIHGIFRSLEKTADHTEYRNSDERRGCRSA